MMTTHHLHFPSIHLTPSKPPKQMEEWLNCEYSLMLAIERSLSCAVKVRPFFQKEVGFETLSAYEKGLIQLVQHFPFFKTSHNPHTFFNPSLLQIFKREVSLVPQAQSLKDFTVLAFSLALVLDTDSTKKSQTTWLEQFNQLQTTPLTALLFTPQGTLKSRWQKSGFELLQTSFQNTSTLEIEPQLWWGRCTYYTADYYEQQAQSHLWVVEFLSPAFNNLALMQ